MRDQYYRSGQGFVLMYSITSRSSFDEIKVIYEQLCRVKDCECGEIPVVLVGNKSDLSDDDRQVTMGEGQEFANSIAAP
jgi:GTPase KRas protein